MPTLAEIRQQFPQYSDLDDGTLAEGLHRKYYSDIPREEFDKKIGIAAQSQDGGAFDTAKDVVKSGGIGLAQGVIGAVTLPGNIEQLGRAGINKVASLAGAKEPVVNPDTYLPNYNDLKGEIEEVTGEFYKPKTTPGEYARTGGEFASLAVGGPGGWANRAARVAVPAVASETAGQLTEGTALEPWARLGGALAGGRVANAGTTAAQRAVTPMPTDPQRQAAVRLLEQEGVTALTAGQKTGRRPLQWTESTLSDIPFAGKKANAMMDAQAEQFTAAALRRAGVNSNRATPDVVDKAFTDLGQQFNSLAARNDMLQSKSLVSRLKQVGDDYKSITAEPLRLPIVEKTIDAFVGGSMAQNGRIPGRVYQNVRSGLSRMTSQLRANDPPAAMAVGKIIDELDRAMEFSIRVNNRADLGAWRTVRGQYRNLLAIEDAVSGAGVGAATGIITPSALRNAVKKQGKRAYVRGKGALGPLARAGETTMKPLPQSGTTPRAVAAGLIGGLSLTDPTMITSLAAPIIAGRALMSGPAQRYFANQAAGASLPAIPQAGALPRGLLAIPGAMDAGLFGGQ
jgi:hypothetical protein